MRISSLSGLALASMAAALLEPGGIPLDRMPIKRRAKTSSPYEPETTRAERRAYRTSKKHKLKGLRP